MEFAESREKVISDTHKITLSTFGVQPKLFFFFRGCCSACKISSQYKNKKHTIPLQNWNMVLISFKHCSVTKSSDSSKCPPCIWFLMKKAMLTIPGKMVLSTQSTSFKKPSKWLTGWFKMQLILDFSHCARELESWKCLSPYRRKLLIDLQLCQPQLSCYQTTCGLKIQPIVVKCRFGHPMKVTLSLLEECDMN